MKIQKRFIVTKYVMGSSLLEVLKNEKNVEAEHISVDEDYKPEVERMGF